MNIFSDWLSRTKVTSVYDSFLEIYSIALLLYQPITKLAWQLQIVGYLMSRLYRATLMSCGTAKHVSVDCTIYTNRIKI